MNLFAEGFLAERLWNIQGSFGRLAGKAEVLEDRYKARTPEIEADSHMVREENGVWLRKGSVRNITDQPVQLYNLASRFTLDGGEYEVYTQYNGWLNESRGAWQPLNTTVAAACRSVRNAHSAAPFLVLWNRQTNRGMAFHAIAYGTWQMQVSRIYAGGESSYIEVEIGVHPDGLCRTLAPGAACELPEILCYPVHNRTDLDCWRLHAYMNARYPRREMPVIYNSWLYKFDRFTFEDIRAQIEKAAQLGVEYFVIDAGWFGKGENWARARGDWEENLDFGFKGRMLEAAELVRASGMKFGLWLEPESAVRTAAAVEAYPEYYLENDPGSHLLLDFGNEEALQFIFEKTCRIIEHYGVSFIKFDFNVDHFFDRRQTGFAAYFEGHTRYIRMLRERYPGLYLENCGSGGMRMTLRDGRLYDSYWLSDNQDPYDTLRIYKDTLLRMPPQWIECWSAVKTAPQVALKYNTNVYLDKLIADGDATWTHVTGVHMSFLQGLLTGSPVGLSCDLTALSEEHFSQLQAFLASFKANRDIWKQAVCHVLTDTETMLVLQYRDAASTRAELVVFTHRVLQRNLRVYPVLAADRLYRVGDRQLTGAQLQAEGLDFPVSQSYSAQFCSICAVE